MRLQVILLLYINFSLNIYFTGSCFYDIKLLKSKFWSLICFYIYLIISFIYTQHIFVDIPIKWICMVLRYCVRTPCQNFGHLTVQLKSKIFAHNKLFCKNYEWTISFEMFPLAGDLFFGDFIFSVACPQHLHQYLVSRIPNLGHVSELRVHYPA